MALDRSNSDAVTARLAAFQMDGDEDSDEEHIIPPGHPSIRVNHSEDRPLPGQGRSQYPVVYDPDHDYNTSDDDEPDPEWLDAEWQAYWNAARAHGLLYDGEGTENTGGGDAIDEEEAFAREWPYERLLELDKGIRRRNGLSVALLSSFETIRWECVEKSNDVQPECVICLEVYKEKDWVIELPCKHVFHDSCLKTWFKDEHTCPNCRLDCSQGGWEEEY